MFENLIREIGVDDVAALNLTIGSEKNPILSKNKLDIDTYGNYGKSMHQIGDYWFVTKISNKDKKSRIEEIAKRLGKDIKVQM